VHPTPQKKSRPRIIAAAVVGVLAVLAFGYWWMTGRHTATPEVVEGWAIPNGNGLALSLHESDDTRDGNGYVIAGADWAGKDNLWHGGAQTPTCIGTDTTIKTHVQLGIVDIRSGGTDHVGYSASHVIWLRCLD
jgi:hypothetical protein